jgi:hypothetical protein
MTEILTESFCERCGTRYTFESAHPKERLKNVKVLSRGLKNFVMSDTTTMDEAMASARSDADREVTASQLDAFHKTFNFCMSCRQYTCPDCWNEVEARCLTCAPHLGHEVMPAPFPPFEVAALDDPPVPAPTETNGFDAMSSEEADAETLRRLTALGGPTDFAALVEPEVVPSSNGANGAAHDNDEIDAVQRLAALTGPAVLKDAPPPIEAPAVDDTPLVEPVATRPDEPSWNLDAEFDAIERRQAASLEPEPEPVVAAVEPEPEPVIVEPEPVIVAEPEPAAVVEPEPVVSAAEPEPEAVIVAEPEPVIVEPEPVEFAAEPEAEPVPAAPEPELAPVAAVESVPEPPTVVTDVVAQPVWHMVAPDVAAEPPTATPPTSPSGPAGEPQWPDRPAWLADKPATGLPFLDRPVAPQGGIDALWAASAQDVVGPKGQKAMGGVQPCLSCGLSLSATARFCRRCGTPQTS